MFRFLARFLEKSNYVKLLSKKNFFALEKLIGHKINKPELYIEAFTHRSVVDNKKYKTSNERLEFLGDSVLGFSTANALFKHFPTQDEGFLTKIRANFVNKNTLYDAGVRINLINFLFISNELLGSLGVGIKTIVADAFEALIGAIYLDLGYEEADKFINKYVVEPNLKLGLHLVDENYKSQLLELTQAVRMEMPKYTVIKEEGPEHERVFTIAVSVSGETLGIGQGRNKKTAEQEAAKVAFKKMQNKIRN